MALAILSQVEHGVLVEILLFNLISLFMIGLFQAWKSWVNYFIWG